MNINAEGSRSTYPTLEALEKHSGNGVHRESIPGELLETKAASNKTVREEARLEKAAIDFEGLLLSQMLQSIRESALGGWQDNHDQGGAVALEMAETQLAQVMASQGGLGIARTLTDSMKNRLPANEAGGSGS